MDGTYKEVFADIYNSANTLFPEQERGTALPDVFEHQLREDENVIEVREEGKVCGFASYHRYGEHAVLTSLYVRREEMGRGIGRGLLLHCEAQVPLGGYWFVKVLKRAPWAGRFYAWNGYRPLDGMGEGLAASLGIVPKDWSVVLWKETNGLQI